MTIGRGRDWGAPGTLPEGAPVVKNDRELRVLLEQARRSGEDPPTVGLLGGDLCRTLGGRGDAARLQGPDAVTVLVDAVRVDTEATIHWFVAHLVAATPTWAQFTFAMNAQWRGNWDVAPSGHPGDGRVELLEGALSPRQRLQARQRVRTGTHLPHPDLVMRKVSTAELMWTRSRRVLLDGTSIGQISRLRLTVEPEALHVVL